MKPQSEHPTPQTAGAPAAGHNSVPLISRDLRLAIDYVLVTQLFWPNRSFRRRTAKQVRQICRSIEQFGFLVPLIIDASNRVISGEARLLAAEKLGLETVPVIRVDHLRPEELLAFQIADNKLAQNAEWDERLLGQTFRELSLLDLEFDLEITGFETAEIDLLIEGLDDGASDVADPDDEAAPDGPAVTQLGDIWEILAHRLACDDARSEVSYAALMGEDRAAVTVADVPYNVAIQGNAAGFGKVKYQEFAMGSGEMSSAQFVDFLIVCLGLIARFSAAGALAYIFIDWRHQFEVMVAGQRVFVGQRNLCVWVKPTGGQGSFYRSRHELVTVWIAAHGQPRNNVQLGRWGKNRTNVWEYASPARLGGAPDDDTVMADHATPKPVAMIADAILDCTARGDIVLDPFLGGGATLIAAERTGRRCRGMEIEPRFVDAAIRRLRRLTGEDARRVSDGRLFSELEKEAADDQR
jgi:DNA modification methylase